MSKIELPFAAGIQSASNNAPNPHMWSSTYWMLFEAGRIWNRCGRSQPINAWKSRGYTVRIDTIANAFVVDFVGDDLTPELRRL